MDKFLQEEEIKRKNVLTINVRPIQKESDIIFSTGKVSNYEFSREI